jgi:glycosyltransferase involved in cell wall biosynthesis
MRVLHVIDSLEPGGTERQCVMLARALARAGVATAVLYFRGGSLLEELRASRITAIHLPVGSYRSVLFAPRLLRLARAVRAWRPDVVQSYGFYSNMPAMTAALLARVPVRIAGRRDLGAYLKPGQRRLERWVWRLAHRIVANSDSVRRQMTVEAPAEARKVVVIRNGLDLGAWATARPDDIAAGEPVVGMIAHFRRQKDHGTFLQAALAIRAVVPAARFVLIGSGVLEKAVRAMAEELGIADRVDFLGELTGDALRLAVSKMTVSVLTSKHNEGLPNAALESMAARLPVVATAVGGATELIEDGVTGFLVPPEVPTIVAERVGTLLRDRALAQRMGQQGRRKAEQEYGVDRMTDRFQQLYRELLASRAGGVVFARSPQP